MKRGERETETQNLARHKEKVWPSILPSISPSVQLQCGPTNKFSIYFLGEKGR